MGLDSLHSSRAIIDTISGCVYFLGPGDYDLLKHLPPGTQKIQCEYAETGHLMMPVDSFSELAAQEKGGGLTTEMRHFHGDSNVIKPSA